MIILKALRFADRDKLVAFVNENNIKREDILIITDGGHGTTIYFYGDSEVKEIAHGLW